jgi:hypothetical protein
MSSGHVAPHPEVVINKSPSDSLNIVAANAYDTRPPPIEAYRTQQFLDITDDLEGPPPYQDAVADFFISIRDTRHPLSSDSAKTFDCSDRPFYVQTDLCTGTGDFILFQAEALETGGLGDINLSETSSSQISWCSDVSMYNSTNYSSASAFAEHQGLIPVESSHSDTDEPYDVIKPVDLSRLLHWLQNISPSSDRVASNISIPSEPALVSTPHHAEMYADFHKEQR